MLAAQVLTAALQVAPAAPPAAPVALPEPAPVPRVTLHEAPRRRRYYGEPKPLFVPGFRLGVGLGARLAGPPADRAHFALDALLYARVGLHRGRIQAAVFPELGYSLGAGRVTRENFLVAGLGLGAIDRTGGFALIPALLVGAAERTRVLGMRTALVLDAFRAGFVFEVAHQVVFLQPRPRHELRLIVGVDLRKLFVR